MFNATFTCAHCGSTDVEVLATARWDADAQSFVIVGDLYTGDDWFCHECQDDAEVFCIPTTPTC